MLGSPITTSHPIDSDIRLVEIEPGFYPANERLLSHAGLTCEIGPGFDPGHAPLLSHEVLALLAEELNNPLRRYSRTPMRHLRAAQIKTDLMDICVPPKDLFIWGNSPFTRDPHDGPGRG